MDLFVILGIALGLAMDAFAVAIATSVMLKRVHPRQVFRLAFHFGLFQFMMPVLGWYAGLTVERWISAWDHWAAFGLLAAVGGKAIWNAVHEDAASSARSASDPTRGWSLVVLSVATSIDALAVGLSFAALQVKIWYPSAIIGVVAAAMTVLGMLAGARLGSRFGSRMEIAGGLVLIAIGLKIVVEHAGT